MRVTIGLRPLTALLAAALAGSASTSRADTLYVSQGGNNTVATYDTTASVPTPTVFASNGLNNPTGLAFDASGNLYVSNNAGDTIEKILPSGVGTVFASMHDPIGLAFDATGNLYVSNGLTIERFTPGGVGTVFATALFGAFGLAFDASGNLYAALLNNNTIEKFTPGGVGSTFASTGLSMPFGLAFDASGNLYASNNLGNTIERFSPTGIDLGAFASTGLSRPEGLAFDSLGNLYAANFGNNTIETFTSEGIGSLFATNLDSPHFLAFPIPEPSGFVQGCLALVWLGLSACARHRLRRRLSVPS